MNSIKALGLGLALALITACTPMIYGVPQDRWDLMTEQERIVAMEAYKERQIAYQKAAAERARIRAEQDAARRARLEDEMRRRQERVDLIYSGRTGTYGDLLEVTILEGQLRLSGKKRGYSPVTFKIADGEVKAVPIYYSKGRKADLYVLYENRHLWFDTDAYGENTRRAGHLIYSRDWDGGITYTGVNSHGSRDMRNVTVNIDVVPIRRGRAIGHRKPIVIVKEKHVQPPPQIIIKEKVVQAPPQVIIKEKIVEKPAKVIIKEKIVQAPEKVVIKEKVVEKPEKVGEKEEKGKPGQKGVGGDNADVSHLSFEELKEKRKRDRAKAKQTLADVQEKAREGRELTEQTEEKKSKVKTAKVVLNGGTILVNGKHRPFNPVKFDIREGETKAVVLSGGDKSATRKAFSTKMIVSYVDGQLYFDGKAGSSKAYRVSARKKAVKISTGGPTGLHKVDVKIDIN